MTLLAAVSVYAQTPTLSTVPTMSPAGGTFDGKVKVGCTFPEGCEGVYFVNGGEIVAKSYTDSIVVDRSVNLSIAGVNSQGRIITDVVTHSFQISHTAPPKVVAEPAEGIRETSFYVTRLSWENVMEAKLDLEAFKGETSSRYGEAVVWLTNEQGELLAAGDYNAIWKNGLNSYKAYIYKNYTQPVGHYTLHIAGGIFILDGVRYEEELELQYEVCSASSAPVFTPVSGTYAAPLSVTISYPTDGSAFFGLYKLNGGSPKSYNGPIVLNESATIEAYGVNEDFDQETRHVTATYQITAPIVVDTLAAPVVSRSGNTLMLSAAQGATIKYWFDDRMQGAAHYTSAISINGNCKLSCLAYDGTRVSRVTDYVVKDMPANRGEKGELVLKTPADLEEMHLQQISENGRFAVGYIGQSDASRGFIWDLSSDVITYPTQAYVNQLLSISNDGTAYGWRMTTLDIAEQVADEDLLWGTCKEGVWTAQPTGMTVSGISPEGILMGSVAGRPALYNLSTRSFEYLAGTGTVESVSGEMAAGYYTSNGVKHPMLWKNGAELDKFDWIEGSATLSTNGKWVLLGNSYRYCTDTQLCEYIISTGFLYPDEPRPENLRGIFDDGTCYGTFDETRLSPDKGIAVVYTTDGVWRALGEWMYQTHHFELDGYKLTSARSALGNQHQILLHATSVANPIEEPFTRGVSISFDTQIHHMAPTAVNAVQMPGELCVKVSWKAPLCDASQVNGYKILRNENVVAEVNANVFEYLDSEVLPEKCYTYTLVACYKDGKSSAMSYGSSVVCSATSHLPIRNLSMRQVGYNSLKLSWKNPLNTLPRLQYFSDEAESYAFGIADFNSEWAVRIPATELAYYAGQSIRSFQFLPTGRQLGYEMRLYAANAEGTLDLLYSQNIDPEALQYGSVNNIMLDEAVEVPASGDLYVALYVVTAGNGDILGIQYDGFRRGYTDLCRIEDIYEDFISIANESSTRTEIVLPLGVCICSEEQLLGGIVDYYEVTEGTDTLCTEKLSVMLPGVADGDHTYSVRAIYRDSQASVSSDLQLTMQSNRNALVGIDSVRVDFVDEHRSHISWDAPLDDDPNLVHWGDLTPSEGLPMPQNIEYFVAAAIYPNTLTADYGSDYEITAMWFYPTSEALFVLALDDANLDGKNIFATKVPTSLQLNTINYVKLDEPIQIDPSVNYRLSIDVFGVEPGMSALAYDSSNHWTDGFSNIIMYAGTYATLADVVSIDEHPNWLMGIEVRRRNSPELDVKGYDVILDGETVSSQQTATEWLSSPLTDEFYTLQIDVTYADGTLIEGEPITLYTDGVGIETLESVKLRDGKQYRNGTFLLVRDQKIWLLR